MFLLTFIGCLFVLVIIYDLRLEKINSNWFIHYSVKQGNEIKRKIKKLW